jgi:hypothetical protein
MIKDAKDRFEEYTRLLEVARSKRPSFSHNRKSKSQVDALKFTNMKKKEPFLPALKDIGYF